jgi:uncharacterized protein
VRRALRLRAPFVAAPPDRFTVDSFSPPLRVKLLVLQPTPFCNIDCTYCYLQQRDSAARMPLSVIQATIRNVIDSGLVSDQLSVAWHAGEPLTVGVDFYRRAFECIDAVVDGRYPVRHSIQTNAILINQEWCDLFMERGVKVGVSVDGPAEIHDLFRKSRDGKGTHAKAMRGVEHLRRSGIPFHAIAVVTAPALQHADEIFDFFQREGFREVGFNIDEREGLHQRSTIGPELERDFEAFLRRMLERSLDPGCQLRIREVDEARKVILRGLDPVRISGESYPHNAQVLPLEVVSVNHAGDFATFSPEFLGQPSNDYGNFVLGNVLTDKLTSVFSNPNFRRLHQEILTGVERCRRECQYFAFCGGGAPANKLYENGALSSTETAYCRTVVQAPLRLMLAQLEQSLQG